MIYFYWTCWYVCTCVFLCILFVIWACVCLAKEAHTGRGPGAQMQLPHPYHCAQTCGSLPSKSSAHSIAFCSILELKETKLVGSTAHRQIQAALLQKKNEIQIINWEQTSGSRNLGNFPKSSEQEGPQGQADKAQTVAWAVPWLKCFYSFSLWNTVYIHTQTQEPTCEF